jgi:potassium efflux system protein
MFPLLLAAALAAGAPLSAQTLTITEVTRARDRAAASRTLSETERKQVLGFYDEALASLDSALRFEAARVGQQRRQAAARLELESLRQAAVQPKLVRSRAAAEAPTLEEAEEALDQVQSEKQSRQRALAELQKVASSLAKRREEINQRLADLARRLEEVSDELAVVQLTSASEVWEAAARTRLAAGQQAAQAERAALEGEKTTMEVVREMLPLQRDAAQARLEAIEGELDRLRQRLSEAELRDAKERMAKAQKTAADLASRQPLLQPIARDIRLLSESLWGPAGLMAEDRRLANMTTRWRDQWLKLQQLSESIKRRYAAAGPLAPAGEWLQHLPTDLPRREQLRLARLRVFRAAAAARRNMVAVEEQRSVEPAVETQVERILAAAPRAPEQKDQLEVQARTLLELRRSIQDEALRTGQSFEDRAAEFDHLSAQMLAGLEDISMFVRRRILWSPSVSSGSWYSVSDLWPAMSWLLFNPDWLPMLKEASSPQWPLLIWVGCAILAWLLLWRRARFRLQLRNPGQDQAAAALRPRSRRLLSATLLTALAASGVPAVLFALHGFFGLAGSFSLGRSVSSALLGTSALLFLLLFVKEVVAGDGLAESVLDWDRAICGEMGQELRWLSAVLPPLAFVFLTLQAEGSLISDDLALQTHNNSLGRLCFLGFLACIFIACWRLLRPFGDVAIAIRSRFEQHWRFSWRFASRFFICGVTAVLILLTALGFYTTTLLFARCLFGTAILTLALGLLSALLLRWRMDEREALKSRSESTAEAADRAESQVRQLSRFVVTVLWLFGALIIWADVLPSAFLLGQVQVYPSIALVSAQQSSGAAAAPAALQAGAPAAVPLPMPGFSSKQETAKPAPAAASALYLTDILLAIFAGIIATILVKDVPGLLEYLVLRRLRLDKGALYAISTITRYIVTILGVIAVSSILGIQWSKVQWLAAALTFGIGFGLQEIFANFASGLILLLDRSIRVGDAVTVGELSGRVSNIQMRATTITLWDRSEMVVPNKEFITSKLVNWTLSYPETRVDVKVGVAYGSNLELVRKTLFSIAESNPNVLKDPAPEVFLMQFADSSIVFELRVFTLFETGRLTVLDQLQMEVDRRFKENGIVIAFPQLDVHIHPSELPGPPAA